MESLDEWITELKKSNLPIIVEGKNDKAALEHFNITKIFMLSKTALFEVVEMVASRSKKCIILTDLDAEGRKLYGRLKKDLNSFGVKLDDSFRDFLRDKTKLRHIEGLISYSRRLSESK
jgi:5S rRNA maturation endonuclease (ribonuclease M5)